MRSAAACALLTIALLATGCLGSSELANVQREMERTHPDAQFSRDVALSAGPLTLNTLWSVTRLSEMEQLRPFISSLEGVKLGVFTVEGALSGERQALPFISNMRDRGWAVAARLEEPPEQTWLLYNARGDRVREFYMLRLDDSQLFVVRLRGDLERILITALQHRDWHVSTEALRINR